MSSSVRDRRKQLTYEKGIDRKGGIHAQATYSS